jgi:PT repeat
MDERRGPLSSLACSGPNQCAYLSAYAGLLDLWAALWHESGAISAAPFGTLRVRVALGSIHASSLARPAEDLAGGRELTKRSSSKGAKGGKSPKVKSRAKRIEARKPSIPGTEKERRSVAELEALKRRAPVLEEAADAAERKERVSKRDVAKAAAWVAPIVLAVNLPSSVFAAPAVSPVAAPTSGPTTAPTAAPTSAPTSAPTRAPTSAPTRAPTSAPTTAPTSAPTSGPTAAPSET